MFSVILFNSYEKSNWRLASTLSLTPDFIEFEIIFRNIINTQRSRLLTFAFINKHDCYSGLIVHLYQQGIIIIACIIESF